MSKASTPKTRLQRTSNPTLPEPESSKKYKIDMSQNNSEMDFNITDLPIPRQFAISDEDIQEIADAVKYKLWEDIVKIINKKTAPLITKIDNFEKQNRKLKNEVDALEQYGRRSLIRISGIPEPAEEGDTTENVRKIISDIDPRYEITDIIRSHRVGKPNEQAAAVVKHRQIIVRLSDPGVTFRILKCGKNLKENSWYRHVYINEDLTVPRSTICYHARLLVKRRKAKNIWTTNGKISLKDTIGEIHNISTNDAFLTTARKVDPTFVKPENSSKLTE